MIDPTDRSSPGRPSPGRKGISSKRVVSAVDETRFRHMFRARFKAAREQVGINQADLAVSLGVSQGRIAHYETGRGLPRLYELPALCRALRCDLNYLVDFQSLLRPITSSHHPNITELSIMSRHNYSTVYRERKVDITLGFDRPLQEYFMTIMYADPAEDVSGDEEYEPPIVYSNLSDPDANRITDLSYYRDKLRALDITVPETLFHEVEQDAQDQVGNRLARHFDDGRIEEEAASSPAPSPEHEPLRVGPTSFLFAGIIQFQKYPSGETGIKVVNEEGDSYVATASVVPYGAPDPGETGVWLKGWSENEGVPQALESAGIVTLTGRTHATGYLSVQHGELTERALKVRDEQLPKRKG